MKRFIAVLVVLMAVMAAPRQASADWLLTGFIGQVTSVKAKDFTPEETFASSRGYGINIASAFPASGGLGFELDWGLYPKLLQDSSEFGTFFASKAMTIAPNFFWSPAVPRVRPYLAVGPAFTYKQALAEATIAEDPVWALGFNVGGGVFIFAGERGGARIDVRYFRNIGEFYDLRTITQGAPTSALYKDLSYIRIFFGGTVVLG